MSYVVGILGKRQRSDITIRPPTSVTVPATYDGWVNSFGADVTSYWKFQGNGTDEKGVQNATITGFPELNVETIVDLDRVSEGAPSDGTCIAWPSTTTEYAQVSHNTAHKTANGTIVITFQCDSLATRSTLLAADANGAAGGIGMEVEPNGAARSYLRGSNGTAIVLLSLAGTIQLHRAYTMILKWGTGLSMAVWDDSGNLVGSRITNASTAPVTGTSPLRFGLYHTNVNSHHGPFGRVIWLSRRITDAEEALLARARTILHGVAPEGRFVSLTGNNANPGTLDEPYRTIEYGASQLLPGETLWVRGGRYTGGITITASGNATNRITIASYPGEIAVIDVNFAEFQTTNNGQWELDPDSPAGTEVYRSVGTSYGTGGASRGTFFVNDVAVGTVLSGLRPYLGLAKIRSTVYEWNETYTYYGGPGFCFSGGRIYVRVQNLASPRNAGITFPTGPQPSVTPLGDITNHPPSSGGFNPNTFSINISDTRSNIRIQGSYITLSRLAVYGGQYGIIIDGGHHVIIERCRLWGATHPVNSATATHDNILRWCDIDSGFSPCFSWFEIHTGGTDEHPRMESKIWSQSGLGDERNLLYQNFVRACFDGVSAVSSTTRDLQLIGNTIKFLFDDLIQFTAQATFEVAYNYIVGPGPGYNGGPGAPGTASHLFHHNILEDRRGEFGWRWNVGAVTTGPGPTPWRDSHNPFASHSVESDCNTPMKIYNNTILYRNNINARGARLERVGAKTGGLHEVYNNIVVGFTANCYVRGVTIGATDQVFDYNLMHHVGAYIVDLMRDMTGTANNDYATLAAWRASQSFQNTKSVYAPGFEANSKEGDPQIPTVTNNPAWGLTTDDYRPSSAGIAASGAKQLSVGQDTRARDSEGWVPVNTATGSSPSTFSPLSDLAAAQLVSGMTENRASTNANASSTVGDANHYIPSAAELTAYLNNELSAGGEKPAESNPYNAFVTGGFSGSTDEIIQWVAAKWGIPVDWLRAQYVHESYWEQTALGDLETVASSTPYPAYSRVTGTTVYQSLGLTQVRWNYPDNQTSGIGTEPLRWKSTAFNADYQAAAVRFYFDDPQGKRTAWGDGTYSRGNHWLSIGGWFNPYPWNNAGQQTYVTDVQSDLSARTWAQSAFPPAVPATAAYFGAVDPLAATGLGFVGVPPGVAIGP